MYKISVILEEHTPILCKPPFCLRIPPLSLGPLLTYLGIPPLVWCDSRPLRSLVGCILTFSPSPAPHPLFPFPQQFPISNTCPPTTTLRHRLHIVQDTNKQLSSPHFLLHVFGGVHAVIFKQETPSYLANATDCDSVLIPK